MPVYSYRCNVCEEVTDAIRTIDGRNKCPPCEKCSGGTRKIISQYTVHSDLEPYYDDNLETHIQSRQHRVKVMKEKDVYEKVGKGWSSW